MAFFVEQIGEEAGRLTKAFKASYPEIDWSVVVNFRHHIVHAYIGVVPDVLWDTVQNDFPELCEFCKKMLSGIKK